MTDNAPEENRRPTQRNDLSVRFQAAEGSSQVDWLIAEGLKSLCSLA